MVGFAPTEREPTITTTPTEANSKTKATQESNEGRAVVRIGVDRAGAPTPVGAKIVPAAVVVRGKAPRFVANPSPSPRGDIRPVAVAVGGPVIGLVVGDPDVTVVGFLPPSAVIVEVAITDDITVYILCGGGIVLRDVPLLRPLIQGVRRWCGTRGDFYVAFRAGYVGAFTGFDRIDLTRSGNFAGPAEWR